MLRSRTKALPFLVLPVPRPIYDIEVYLMEEGVVMMRLMTVCGTVTPTRCVSAPLLEKYKVGDWKNWKQGGWFRKRKIPCGNIANIGR